MVTKDKRVKKTKNKAPAAIAETRQALMLKAKERGVKNFRILNRAELARVLEEGMTQEKINEVVAGSVARWKSGWGTKKARK